MRRHAPAAARNRAPILAVLERVVGNAGGVVLEIGCGTGEHALFFAENLPSLSWIPTDVDPEALESCRAWREHAAPGNLGEPLFLDAASDDWPVDAAELIYSANVVHISPWSVTVGLMRGAGRLLAPAGQLFMYGPFLHGDDRDAPSNLRFDASLRQRDPTWGVRKLADVVSEAEKNGLVLAEQFEMPANNLSLLFRRRSTGDHALPQS